MSNKETKSQNVLEVSLQDVSAHRTPDYPVNPLFVERWSSRSFADQPVPQDVLYTVLEAARWAPSSNNLQPWLFYIAQTEEERELFKEFILPGNRIWSDKAPVLILLATDTRRDENGGVNGAHAFDAGAAWGSIALQAHLLGLATRAMGGYDRNKAREILDIPEYIELQAVIALGYRAGLDTLDERFREREIPNERRSLSDSILELKRK